MDQSLGSQLLSAMLPLGSQFLDTQSFSQDKMETSLDAFEDFFESLVLLAGTNKDNGHLILAKAVEEWMPSCINLVKSIMDRDQTKDKEEQTLTDAENKRASIPVGALFRYLAHLTSAVQFVTNMVKCTEKRALAAEYDGPLYDSESEDEGEGMGGAEIDEDSQGEESVSRQSFTCSTILNKLLEKGVCFYISKPCLFEFNSHPICIFACNGNTCILNFALVTSAEDNSRQPFILSLYLLWHLVQQFGMCDTVQLYMCALLPTSLLMDNTVFLY